MAGNISSIGRGGAFPAQGSIKSVQRGTTTGNVTVASVNTGKSRLTITGASSGTNQAGNAYLTITNSTTLTYDKGSLTTIMTLAWELIEEY